MRAQALPVQDAGGPSERKRRKASRRRVLLVRWVLDDHCVDKPAGVGVDVHPFGDGQCPFLQDYSSFPLDAHDVLELLLYVDALVYHCG